MEQYFKKNAVLGARIKAERKKRNMTQEQMAAQLQLCGHDVSRSAYSKIEDARRHISLEELAIICEIFKMDYNQMLGYQSPKNARR